jgi:hypothetical protein
MGFLNNYIKDKIFFTGSPQGNYHFNEKLVKLLWKKHQRSNLFINK